MPVIRHQMNQFGRHRIVVDEMIGDWTLYDHVAEHPAGYMALTQYYGDKERVVKIEQVTDVHFEESVYPESLPKVKG